MRRASSARLFASLSCARRPEIVEATYVSGPFEYLIKAVVPDMASWTNLSESLLAGDLGVAKIVTHVLMKKPKRFAGYPIPRA